jgi:hypothetical protein
VTILAADRLAEALLAVISADRQRTVRWPGHRGATVYIPSLMLMTLHEERVRDFDRRAAHADTRPPQALPARSSQPRPWPARAFAAASGRSRAGARTAGLATARARS